MTFNKYNLQIIVRVIFIFFTLLAVVYFIPQSNKLITIIFFAALAIIQTFLLIRFFNSINRDLARFLLELKENDTTELFLNENQEKKFKYLKYAFQQISDEIKKTRIEKISQEHYLKYIIENISDGLISFDEEGMIQLINNSALKLFSIQYLSSIWELDKLKKGLAKKLMLAKPGSKILVNVSIENKDLEFLFKISEVKIENQDLKIVSFQDLKSEFETKEINAWKKLMRILTHEIMNSLTPISTLSAAIRRILKKDDQLISNEKIKTDDLSDILKNSDAIERKSKNLLDYINQFRQLRIIPDLKLEKVEVITFFKNIQQLFSEELKQKEIELKLKVNPADLSMSVDTKLMEQLIINLIKNSIDALEISSHKQIIINALRASEFILISIYDNGTGIKDEIKDEVFVPFYTTKESGSGIGLSLSKEIIIKHKGEIYFESETEKGTTFYLKFPQHL